VSLWERRKSGDYRKARVYSLSSRRIRGTAIKEELRLGDRGREERGRKREKKDT